MESKSDFIKRKLKEFYNGSVPSYIIDAGKTHLTIRVKEGLFAERDYVVTICSVQEYFSFESEEKAEEELAGIKGDPQFIYNLAMECFRWFRFISPEEYR